MSLPATYNNMSSANIRKNLILSVDFARTISKRNENSRDKITEIMIFRKKEPTDTKEKVSPATIKLKRIIPRISEKEAS